MSAAPTLVTERWLAHVDPAVLRHLAAAADGAAHRRRWAPVVDPERTAAELADLLASGERPALGWWRPRIRRQPAGFVIAPKPEIIARVTAEVVIDLGSILEDCAPVVANAMAEVLHLDRGASAAHAAVQAGLLAASRLASNVEVAA